MSDTSGMNREERIAKARQMAARNAPDRATKTQQQGSRVAQRLANVGASQAQRHVAAAEQSGDTEYLGPVETPQEWERAVELARAVAITRAKRHDTITHGEVMWVIYDELRMLVGYSKLQEFLEAIDREADRVLLSSIVLDPDTGHPLDGFTRYADDRGFGLPLATLQRQVYEHFG